MQDGVTVQLSELLQLQAAATTCEIIAAIIDAADVPDYAVPAIIKAVIGPATTL